MNAQTTPKKQKNKENGKKNLIDSENSQISLQRVKNWLNILIFVDVQEPFGLKIQRKCVLLF